MHLLKVIGLMSLALWADTTVANPVCASGSVIFVTVTAPVATKTVSVPVGKGSAVAAVETAIAVSQASAQTDITTTLTSYVTFTEFIKITPATPTLSGSSQAPDLTASRQEPADIAADKGPYYFSEHNGTLVWLGGKTPPATGSFVTSTTFITVQPVPSSLPASAEEKVVSTAEGSIVSTSYSTISLYSVTTIYQTKVVTSTIRVPAIPVKAFVSPGSGGWNTSFVPVLKEVEVKVLSGNPKPIAWQTGAIDIKVEKSITYPVSAYATTGTEQLEARQVGALVVATIDGAVVSWINSYDGKPTSTTPVISWINVSTGPLPATTPSPYTDAKVPTEGGIISSSEKSENQPVYPWDLSPAVTHTVNSTPNCSKSSASSSVAPADRTVNVAVYPWDLTPPLLQKTTSDIGPVESFLSSSKTNPAAVTAPANLAIYPWDLSLPSGRTTASAPNNTSWSTLSSKTTARSNFPIKSKSTLSTVTTKSITSEIPLTLVKPAPVKGPSVAESSGLSNSANNPSFCDGEPGAPAEFVLTFDDLPTFSTGPNATDIPPIFNPYRKLYFEEHFGYVPPPSVSFLPHSPPQLAVYRVGDGLNVNGSPGAGLELVGEFGSGPRALYSAFWIDAFSFWIGCKNEGTSDCKVNVNGYELGSVIRTAYQDVIIPPCRASRGCKLTYVELGKDFRNLTGVQILAAVDRQLTDFYLDDVKLAWSNNTCAAQQQRATVR